MLSATEKCRRNVCLILDLTKPKLLPPDSSRVDKHAGPLKIKQEDHDGPTSRT